MFRSKQILPLFPSNVWVHDLEPAVYEPMNKELKSRIEELLSSRPQIGPGETWQTRNDLQDDLAFGRLMQCARSAVDGVLEFLAVEPLPYEVTGCWANVNPSGSPHNTHMHPNNYLSGVYYVQTSPGDSITFHDPREYSQFITPKFRAHTQHNSQSINIEAKSGRMAIFPAWLKHSVPPNESPEERVSVAFNFMFSDFTRTVSRPRWKGI